MKRNRRAGVEDRWTKTICDEYGNKQKVPSANDGKGKRWRARYVDDQGHERAKAFTRKADAQAWLDCEVTAKLATGTYVAPQAGLLTVSEMDVCLVVRPPKPISPPRQRRCGRLHHHLTQVRRRCAR